jgi:hypothetical protein
METYSAVQAACTAPRKWSRGCAQNWFSCSLAPHICRPLPLASNSCIVHLGASRQKILFGRSHKSSDVVAAAVFASQRAPHPTRSRLSAVSRPVVASWCVGGPRWLEVEPSLQPLHKQSSPRCALPPQGCGSSQPLEGLESAADNQAASRSGARAGGCSSGALPCASLPCAIAATARRPACTQAIISLEWLLLCRARRKKRRCWYRGS